MGKKFINEGCVCQSDKSLVGKTVIITGGNAGIGKATAIQCAKLKAHLIIASRNVDKSMKARDEIIKETGHHDIHVMKLDLADLDSVSKFADEILSKEKHIDFLINNAGVMWLDGATKQGFGTVFAINHLGPFLLTNLLLPHMKEQSSTRPVRIINLSSDAYKIGEVDFSVLHTEQYPQGLRENFKVYGASKLANVYFTSALSKCLHGFDISTYSVHPGIIWSDLGTSVPTHFRAILGIVSIPFLRESFYGCQTTMVTMLSDDISQYSGDYFSSCTHDQLQYHATDDIVGEKLWKLSEDLVQTWMIK